MKQREKWRRERGKEIVGQEDGVTSRIEGSRTGLREVRNLENKVVLEK